MRIFSLKVADDDPVAVYLAQTGNVSATLRAIVEAYLAQGNGNPPPPPEPPQPAPTGGVAIDYDKLGEAVYQATRRALSEVQIAIPAGAALNEEPVKVKARDGLLDDILAGLNEWGQ